MCSRLGKRLRHLGLGSFSQYHEYLSNDDGDHAELGHLVNCVTTNKTEFFREPHHFEFLRSSVVPALVARARDGAPRKIRIWSAGCSTGEEPYSIAMLLADALPRISDWDVKILASDIDTAVLARAAAGVYSERTVAPVPLQMRRSAFARFDDTRDFRVADELRRLVTFRHINLIDDKWPIRTHFDVIFCRNVTIYFDRTTQEQLYTHFTRYVGPQGYFIAGHSENLHWLSHLFQPAGNTIYALNPELLTQKSQAPRPGSLPARAGSRGPHRSRGPRAGRSRAPAERAHGQRAPTAERAPTAKRAPTAERAPAAERARASDPMRFPGAHLERPSVPARCAPVSKRDPLDDVLIVDCGVERVRIQSGEIYAGAEPSLVSTVLGSCVATCLFDLESGVGGMNHFMLPDSGQGSWLPACYGIHAMELLVDQLLALGAHRGRLKAKIFGGAHVLAESEQGRKVADSNAAFAREFLAREGIPLLAERLGGTRPLQVHFFTHTGKVLVRAIRGQGTAIADVETRYLSELNERVTQAPPSATLF